MQPKKPPPNLPAPAGIPPCAPNRRVSPRRGGRPRSAPGIHHPVECRRIEKPLRHERLELYAHQRRRGCEALLVELHAALSAQPGKPFEHRIAGLEPLVERLERGVGLLQCGTLPIHIGNDVFVDHAAADQVGISRPRTGRIGSDQDVGADAAPAVDRAPRTQGAVLPRPASSESRTGSS